MSEKTDNKDDINKDINSEDNPGISEGNTSDELLSEDDTFGNVQPEKPEKKETNYQVSLIDERNLLIKIVTERSVSIDCSVKDKGTVGSDETQSNKIFIHPKTSKQEVDILVTIGKDITSVSVLEDGNKGLDNSPDIGELKPVLQKPASEFRELARKLIPNPLVADLIGIKRDEDEKEFGEPKTPEEWLKDKLGRKNLWRVYRKELRQNLIRGFSGAMVVFLIAISVFASIASKKINTEEVIEQRRLVIMQDLPENFNQGQNVEDPNKPPDKPKSEDGTEDTRSVIPNLTPKKINKPYRINVPKTIVKLDTNISNTNKELDSLRKTNITDNKKDKDTSKIVNANLMPDSLLKSLNENEVGLLGRFPPSWKQMDSRQININQKEFTGVILVDTAVKKKEEALTMNIQLDPKSEYWSQFTFKNVFEEDSLRTIYSLDPKSEANQTYYRFYLAGKTDNVFVSAFVESTYFEKYKPEIERVVRSIRIQRQQKPSGQK